MAGALVYSESKELAQALAAKAAEAGCARVDALALSPEVAEALKGKVDTLYVSSGSAANAAEILKGMAAESKPDLILLGAGKSEKVAATLLAAALGAGLVNECTDLRLTEGGVEATKLVSGGVVTSRKLIKTKPAVATINARSSSTQPAKSTVTSNVPTPATPAKVRVLETRKRTIKDAGLDKAKCIVSAGRGFKKKEDLAILNDLAACLDAAVGCTRPISADLEWMDQWIGISGKKIAPNLYVTCGVSGTIQHVAGINDSKIIVSVNSDEAASIHAVSDYSVIGDLYQVLPLLVAELKKRKK